MKAFWMDVQRSNNKIKHSEVIDGVSNVNGIIDIFTRKFLHSNPHVAEFNEQGLLDNLKSIWNIKRKFYLNISPKTLKRLINKLSIGEGHDGINAIFFKKGL